MTDTPSGISMALRLLQPEKSVRALTPSGNVMLVSLVQSAKLPTVVTPSGTVISVMPVPLKMEVSYRWSGTLMSERLEQP